MGKIKFLVVAGLMAFGSQGVEAQAEKPKRGERVEVRRDRDIANDLTAAQKAQIKVIRDRYKVQYRALHAEAKAQRVAVRTSSDTGRGRLNREIAGRMHRRMMELKEAERREIAAVLTPAQRVEMQRRMDERWRNEERKANHGRRGHDRREWGQNRGRGDKKVRAPRERERERKP